MTELEVLRDVTARLDRVGLPYMLTGSLAMNYYAEPRMTRDIDLVVDVRPGDISGLVAAFESDYYLSRAAIEEAVRRRSLFNLIHNESLMKIDVVVRKETPYRKTEFERRRRVHIGDATLYVVSKEDLIVSKIAWARDSRSDVQKRDIENLLATEHDDDYLTHWLNELDLYSFAEQWLS